MAVKYTGGKTVTVTVGNLASDTVACAYWYTGAVSPKGYSYVIKGLLDDGNNSTSTDFSYNTLLKGDNSSNTTATTTFKTVDNIYDSTNGRYPTYVWAYVNLLPHFHYPSEYGSVIKTSYIEVRQRQNSISTSTTSFSVYWNEGGASSKTISPTITCSPSNSYTKTINVKHSNASITESNSTVTSGNALSIKVKGKGSSTITLSPSDGAGGTSTTISVTGKTAVTNMTATYTGNLNTGASTTMTVSKTPSAANATTFSISKTGTATVPSSGTFGTAFNVTGTGSSPVITVTSADGLKSNSFKITNYTATVACSGSTPLKGQTFTYTKSGGYGTGTYSFTNCEHYSAGTAKVTANSGTATVKWTPSDGGSVRSGSLTLGVSTTGISATGYTYNLNTGASTSVTVSRTPSNSKIGTFTGSVTSGTATAPSGNYGTATISNTSGSPVVKFTSGDGFVSTSIKIANHTASVACSGSTPLKGQTFTYTKSGGYGTGTYSFTNCEHYSAGTAKVTANSGTATVKWTPSDGGTVRSGSLTLGVSTTGISATGYTYNLNTGASTSVTVSRTPSNSKIGTFTGSVTSGTATAPSGNYGTATISNTSGSPVVKFTSGDGFVSTSIKIANHTASVACSGSTPIINETFTYTKSGGYGTGTYSFTNCEYIGAGLARVNVNASTASVSWKPSDGGSTRTGSITLGKVVTDMSLSGTTNVNAGGSTSLTVTGTPSDAKYKKFDIVKSSGTGTTPASGTFGTAISLTGLSGSPEFLVTSYDGCVEKTFKITSFTPSVSITASTPIYNQTFTYSLSNYTGSGTWSFTNCKHYSTGTAQVTANSGTATVKWTPSDGGTAASKSTTLGVTTTSVAINGNASASGSVSINSGATAKMKVNIYGPGNATPKTNSFNASLSGTGTLSATSGSNGSTINVTGAGNGTKFLVTSGDGFVSSGATIYVCTPSVSITASTPIYNQTFTYSLSNYTGSGTWSFTNCKHYSTGTAQVTANSGTATVKWTPSDGGTAASKSTTLGVTTTSVAINGNTSASGSVSINSGATAKMKVNIYGPGNATPKTNSFNASLSGTGTLSATSGSNGSTINVTGAGNGTKFLVTSGDGFVSSGATIYVCTPSVSITASTPIYNQTFTYSLSNYTGSGTWSFTNCKHYSTGTAQVTANSGTATVKWTPSDGGTAVSKSTTLGVTTTSVAINGNTSHSTEYINNGGSKSLTINLYGPSNATPKNKTFTVSTPYATLSNSSGTTGGTITVSNVSSSSLITVTSGDKKASNSITIVEENPIITLSNTSNNWKGKTFTYTLSDYVGSGTWTLTNCKYYSSGNATITGTSGSATVKWTPGDGGTAVSKSLALKTYTTPSTSISFTDSTYSYYSGDIYWRSFKTNVTNAANRTVTLSISNGIIGTTPSGSGTSVTVSAGSTVWARRSNSSNATVTANVSALTVNNSTTYTFYNAASATKTIS